MLLCITTSCAGAAPPPVPAAAGPDSVPGLTPAGAARFEAEARRRMADDGLAVGRWWVVGGAAWRSAAAGVDEMAGALDRAALPGLRVEPRGRSFCARTPAGADCLFVSVVDAGASTPPVHEIRPEQVEAVVLVEPAPPDEGHDRMLWREELRTGRLLLFLRGWGGAG